MQAFAETPLQRRQQTVREDFFAGPKPQAQLDTTVFSYSPPKDFIDEVRANVLNHRRPANWAPDATKRVNPPAGGYTMVADPAIRVRVEFGPLMWQKAERGAPGIGTTLNVVA